MIVPKRVSDIMADGTCVCFDGIRRKVTWVEDIEDIFEHYAGMERSSGFVFINACAKNQEESNRLLQKFRTAANMKFGTAIVDSLCNFLAVHAPHAFHKSHYIAYKAVADCHI